MGIFCEINLFKPSHEIYQPGQVVSGVIKYAIDEPMEIEKITTSMKGIAKIVLKVNPGQRYESTYESVQELVDIDTIIQDTKVELPVGSYEVKFSYILPRNIPSTMKFRKYFRSYKVKCFIRYYIRIKIERPGLFAFNKHFRKEINVVSEVISRLSRDPVVYEESKKLTHLFSSNDSVVNIKTTITDSAVPFGGKITVHYKVENKSSVLVKSITIKLVEAYFFKAKGHRKLTYEEEVPGTEAKTTSIDCEDSQNVSVYINVPANIHSIENTIIVCRHYFVRIVAKLPLPHRNLVCNIPVQIGVFDANLNGNMFEQINENQCYSDAPPSYWEAMGETKNEYAYEDKEKM